MATRKEKKPKGVPLAEVVADRVRSHRERLQWTQDELAAQMSLIGFNWNRVTVAEAEGKGRGRRVTVEELLGLAALFGVGVVHLLALDSSNTQITENLTLLPAQLQALVTIGLGQAGPPELRRMQLEFQRDRARAYLQEQELRRDDAHMGVETARAGLEHIESELAALSERERSSNPRKKQ
jgi:transcriptional regulator with XRE-family HTH domain